MRAPNANAYADRWIRTVRAECLDWLLIIGRGHLEQSLACRCTAADRRDLRWVGDVERRWDPKDKAVREASAFADPPAVPLGMTPGRA